jgi:superfamily II DNA or RNA helicase
VPNQLIEGLRALGLFNIKKAIPHVYKTASESDRLEMLAGLIDTDGHFSHGMYDIIWKSEELANDTVFIARSLGFFAKVSKCLKEATNSNAGKQPYHRVSISGDVSRIPCKVARKKAPTRTQIKSVLKSGIDVQPIGRGEYFGFELEGDCKLFLLGDFQVTHNSVVSAHHLLHEPSVSVFLAHRAELLSGESLALARNGVRHRVIGQPALRRECSRRHVAEGLYDHVDHRARTVIASVQTLVGLPDSDPLWAECRLLVLDEVHHQVRGGSHGKVREKMVNARALGLSATPIRADGKGLGRHADGYMDVMIEGPNARDIELMGFLAPHVIYAPPSDLDLSQVPVAASGDYSPKPLAEATRRSHILGDVVDHYRRLADGLLGMTFCVDVESATLTAAAFRAAGVPAEVVTGKTPSDARNAIFRKFRNRQILQLVSCEIAGEGFDLPDVEVISLARASESYALVTQQIGRGKRILPGKTKGIVIDHVGNTTRHCQAKQCQQTGEWYIAVGEREWTLDRRERRTASKKPLVAITTCPSCLRSYERVLGRKCPYCSHETQPAGRSAPEQVDGVLAELDPATLAQMQRDIAHVDGAPTIPWGATPAIQGAVAKRHRERQEAQGLLRAAMAQWAGTRSQLQDADSVARLQREFWLAFGVDVASAQALGRAEADELCVRVDSTVKVLHSVAP